MKEKERFLGLKDSVKEKPEDILKKLEHSVKEKLEPSVKKLEDNVKKKKLKYCVQENKVHRLNELRDSLKNVEDRLKNLKDSTKNQEDRAKEKLKDSVKKKLVHNFKWIEENVNVLKHCLKEDLKLMEDSLEEGNESMMMMDNIMIEKLGKFQDSVEDKKKDLYKEEMELLVVLLKGCEVKINVCEIHI
ncbi:kinetochore protein Nuf2-like [Silurus meridionalis]|uniref:kinetochore protein Nuf2-like n=1 Tax=Silurus meridionalis TaxID=175797 RepID=UPI001EEB4E6E|nr:kinetochore protein Nuf2-like [Silurus meridionalis]